MQMKHLLKRSLSIVALFIFLQSNAQEVVLSNNFSTWSGGDVVGWNGSTTHNTDLTVSEVTEGAVFGSSAVKLAVTPASPHRRFSSDPTPIEEGVEYRFKYYVRGSGEIRVGLFDTDVANEDFGYKYSPYQSVNSQDWIEVNQAIIADFTAATAQFIFSVRNTVEASGDIQIDSVSIVTGEVTAVTIYDIQFTTDPAGVSPLVDQVVNTGGIVTAVLTGQNGGFWLQSGSGPWNGIFVFEPNNVGNVAVGDSVFLTATVAEFFNTTQLASVNGLINVSSGNTVPAPAVANTSTLATEAYEGVLVRALDAQCTAAPNQFNEWPINDGSGAMLVDDVLFAYTPTVGVRYNVTGVVGFSFSAFRIYPRQASDVEAIVGLNDLEENGNIQLFPNPASDIITLSSAVSIDQVELMNIQGQIVRTFSNVNASQYTLDLNALSSGLYMVRLTSGNQSANRLISIK
jgi:hypothetical protein